MYKYILIYLFSKKKKKKTKKRHFFHNLILPIKWSHPIIYSLSEQLLPILESPVPILVGININEN